MRVCINCQKNLILRHQLKYCSNRCQVEYQYNVYISAWKKGTEDGSRGIVTKNISLHLKRYLMQKYGEHCSLCKWNKKHQKTGVVPLEIDHIDGDASNNNEGNLRLLCPNCHALTPTFRNLNKGKGRNWRSSSRK